MYLMESAPGARTFINDREVDYFCGTGYLGLQGHPDLIEASCDAVNKYGIGSATSRFGYGDNPVLLDVEAKAADFWEKASALYYISGYLGNSILLKGLQDAYDIIFVDEASHYSVLDGAYTARKDVAPFSHLDAGDLRNKLKKKIQASQRPLVICDGVFPVSGEISPLPDYRDVLNDYDDALLCVDDAHATGVLGAHGRGTFEYFGMEGDDLYASHTLSKALGGHGGVIAGDEPFVQHLRGTAHVIRGASAVPTPAAAAAAKGLEMYMNNSGLRTGLWDNVAFAKRAFRKLGFHIPDTPVPIICLHLEGVDLESLQHRLFECDIAVLYTPGGSYSSVPQNGAIRIAIFSTHTKEQIERLVGEIERLI
jgi:8-amino-7-oxononanoate synthase